ncbi:unnamed protein product, partial [marine sediment metagenome]
MTTQPNTVTVYHGTRADPELIRKEGLVIPDPEEIYQETERLRQELMIPDPPKWAKDLAWSRVQHRLFLTPLSVHVTFSKRQAELYTEMGGEIFSEIATYLLWRRYGRFRRPEKIRRARWDLYDFIRGKDRYVVTLRIPFSWLPSHVQHDYLLMTSEGEDPS